MVTAVINLPSQAITWEDVCTISHLISVAWRRWYNIYKGRTVKCIRNFTWCSLLAAESNKAFLFLERDFSSATYCCRAQALTEMGTAVPVVSLSVFGKVHSAFRNGLLLYPCPDQLELWWHSGQGCPSEGCRSQLCLRNGHGTCLVVMKHTVTST